MPEPKLSFQASAETVRLKRRMSDMRVGDVISYGEILEVIASDPQTKGRHIVDSARNALRREKLMVFGTVTNVGVKRLDDLENLDAALASTRKIHRAARRSSQCLACTDPVNLPMDKRASYYGTATILAVLSASTTTRSIRAIEAETSKTNGVLPLKSAMLSMG